MPERIIIAYIVFPRVYHVTSQSIFSEILRDWLVAREISQTKNFRQPDDYLVIVSYTSFNDHKAGEKLSNVVLFLSSFPTSSSRDEISNEELY